MRGLARELLNDWRVRTRWIEMNTVTQLERERLLDAVLEEAAEKGHREVDVIATLRRAGIHDEGRLAEFASKEACLLAAYERLTERLTSRVIEGCTAGREWPQRVRAGLEALLDELAAQPRMARVAIRGFPSIGNEARARYLDFIEGFVPLLRGGREFSGMAEELPAEVEMLAVGAAEAIVFEEIEAGRAAQLPALGPAILFSILVPFLGPKAASAAMEKASEEAEEGDLEAA
jgi:AcrR family transcriptional regulator